MPERTLYHEVHVALSFREVKGKPFAVAGRLGLAIGVLFLDLEVRPHGIVLPQDPTYAWLSTQSRIIRM